jgi:glycosyltransferase involved in cell wall biosynthesis
MKKRNKKTKVLIAFLSENDSDPIPIIVQEYIRSKLLNKKYEFIPFYKYRKFGRGANYRFNLINICYFIKHFINWTLRVIINRPDIVHYPISSYWDLPKSISMLKIGSIFKAKKIGHLHSGAFIDFFTNLNGFTKKIVMRELNDLDALIVTSDYWKIMLEKNCKIETKIEVVFNPINKVFENSVLKSKPKKNDGPILFVGRIMIEKGILDIIKAANLLKNKINKNFVFAGPTSKKKDLNEFKDLTHKYNLKNKIILKGVVVGQEKSELFKQASIFLLPSYAENFPLVVIEAAAAGLPIIATRVGALPDFFKHNESIIFIEPGNINQLAAAIDMLINNKLHREKLARGAREVFLNKLSRQKIMISLDNVYRKVLNV